MFIHVNPLIDQLSQSVLRRQPKYIAVTSFFGFFLKINEI
jgi:hypothetical protein